MTILSREGVSVVRSGPIVVHSLSVGVSASCDVDPLSNLTQPKKGGRGIQSVADEPIDKLCFLFEGVEKNFST